MKSRRDYLIGILSAIGIVIIILDSKTSLAGASAGIELCAKTVIPALFPFFFLTGVITKTLQAPLSRLFKPIGKIYKIPEGSESTLVLGLLGGYPIGAKAVHNLYCKGYLNKNASQRMLTFCNNPGPAFIFGMVGCLFDSLYVPWAVWCIIITCSFLTSWIQPTDHDIRICLTQKKNTGIVESSLKAMATVCAWVIIFRVILAVLQHWILWILPEEITILINGLLELANGCTSLSYTENIIFRFCSITAMLCFGGFCVTMQTMGVTGDLLNSKYILGKLFQTFLSVPLSYITAIIIFSKPITIVGVIIMVLAVLIACILGYILHKNSTGKINKNDI